MTSLREQDRDMKLEFKIPDTAGLEGVEKFSVLSDRLRQIVQSGGRLSNEGKERKEKIKQAMSGKQDALSIMLGRLRNI